MRWVVQIEGGVFQDDMLSWLMDSAQAADRVVEALTRRILVLNFLAIHTSTSVSALLCLWWVESGLKIV